MLRDEPCEPCGGSCDRGFPLPPPNGRPRCRGGSGACSAPGAGRFREACGPGIPVGTSLGTCAPGFRRRRARSAARSARALVVVVAPPIANGGTPGFAHAPGAGRSRTTPAPVFRCCRRARFAALTNGRLRGRSAPGVGSASIAGRFRSGLGTSVDTFLENCASDSRRARFVARSARALCIAPPIAHSDSSGFAQRAAPKSRVLRHTSRHFGGPPRPTLSLSLSLSLH